MKKTVPDEVASAVDAGLGEHALEVLWHGVGRDAQALADLCRGHAMKHATGHVLLAFCEFVGGHEQRDDPHQVGGPVIERHGLEL